jgi:hypothetical protein
VRNVLERSAAPPSTIGLTDYEIARRVPCACGHRLVPPNPEVSVRWYWQLHSVSGCSLELPDVTCCCGLKRSEHVDGHARTT